MDNQDKQLDLFEDDLNPNLEAGEPEDLPFEGDFLFLEPRESYDVAILGLLNGDEKLVYDAQMVIELTAQIHGMSMEEAEEFFDYNIAGSLGDNFPVYVWRTEFEIERNEGDSVDL